MQKDIESKEAFKEVILKRMRYFQSKYHAHEAGQLALAVKAIEDLIPPEHFEALFSPPVQEVEQVDAGKLFDENADCWEVGLIQKTMSKEKFIELYNQRPDAGKLPYVRFNDQPAKVGIYHALYNGDHVIFQVHDGGFRVINYHGERNDSPALHLIKYLNE